MTERPTENDLLDLIEGKLPAGRVEIVRAALMSDRELLARVEGMVRDRRVLQESAASDPRAPRGLAQESIARAERDALFGEPSRAARHRRGRPALVGLALAASVAIVAVGVVISLSRLTKPAEIKVDGVVRINPDGTPSTDTSGGVDLAQAAAEPQTESTWVPPEPIVVVPKSDPRIDAWTREIAQQPAEPSPTREQELPWLTDETVRLAREGRLKLIVPPGVLLAQSDPSAAPVSAIDRPRRIAISFRTHDGADGIRRALALLPAQIPGVPAAMIRAAEEPAPTDSTIADDEPISLSPNDILWWTRPASEWARYSRVYVTVAPAEASPERK